MNSTLLIAAWNIRRFIRNRSFFILAIGAPFLIMAALSSTIGSAISGEFRPAIAIADELGDGSLDGLITGLEEAGFDRLQVVESRAEARRLVEDGGTNAAIIFTAETAQSFGDPRNDPAAIVVVADADAEISRAVSEAIASNTARNFDSIRILNELGAPADDLTAPLVVVDAESVGSRVLTDGTYFAVGMASYFTFFAASALMATIHRERRESTLARMMVAPINRADPLIGKGIAAGGTALGSYAVLVVASSVLLGADWGPPLGAAAIGASLCLAAVGVSSAIVSMTKTEESAGQIGAVIATAWAIFGGVLLQIPSTGWFSTVARLSPFKWAIEGIGLNAGAGTAGEVLISAIAIAVFGIIGLGITVFRGGQGKLV
ncbi:MAG: ABC transporter permease [Acidimicrobiia bacterium]